MKQQWEYLNPLWYATQQGICDFLSTPYLWSEAMIHKTMERTGGKPFNVEDVRAIIKDYLAVLTDYVRRGGTPWTNY